MKRQLLILVAVLLMASLLGRCLFSDPASRLKIGMSDHELKQIMGETTWRLGPVSESIQCIEYPQVFVYFHGFTFLSGKSPPVVGIVYKDDRTPLYDPRYRWEIHQVEKRLSEFPETPWWKN